MARNVNPDKVLTDAKTILEVWNENKDFKLKDVTLENVEADCVTLEKSIEDIAKLELKLTPLRNLRDDVAKKLNETNTRARSGIKGYFGGNSSQYDQVGGTRTSERAKGGRKPKPTETK